MQLRPGLHVLPAEEVAEEVLRGGGLDLAPQPPQRQRMDAREQRPLAPFGPGGALAVAPAQDEAIVLEQRQLGLDGIDAQLARQLGSGDGPGDADPAAHRIDELALRTLRGPPDTAGAVRAARRLQLGKPRPPLGRRLRQQGQRQEQVVQLVGRAQIRKRLLDHLGDRLRIERAQRSRVARIQRPAHLHRPRPALLQRRVVEVRIRRRVEDLVRERRRFGGVARQHADLAVAHPLQEAAQPFDVHRLGEAVAQRLAHQRMVGRLDGAGPVLLALRLRRKDLRQQVVGAHAQDIERHLLSSARAQDRQRSGRVPAPAHAPHRRPQRCLRQHFVDAARGKEIEDGLERKAVLRTQREQDAFVGGCRLQLEVEGPAEALAQRQAEGAVLPGAEGRVDDELHSARFVEEPLGHQGPLRRQRAQRRPHRAEVADDLFRAFGRHPALLDQPRRRGRGLGQHRLDLLAQARDFFRQLGGPSRRLAIPERHRGRRAVRVLDPHPSRLDAPDAPALVAEQKRIARHALDGPVFVDLPDGDALGLGHHRILRGVGDGAAGGDRREPRPAPRLEDLVDAVAVQPRPLRPARPPRHALGVHLDHLIEVAPGKIPIIPGSLR